MLRIRYGAPTAEIDLEGSRQDLLDLQIAILKILKSGRAELLVPADTSFDPSPYDAVVCAISVVVSTADKGRVTVSDDHLLVVGPERMLRNFAANLPCNASPPRSGLQYHVHYDRISFEDCLDENSMHLVISLRNE
jgi:hypothetical protein